MFSQTVSHTFRRRLSSSTPPKTAIVMLNMGGPSSLHGEHDGVQNFLTNLFSDPDIIPLGRLQGFLGPLIAKRRSPKIIAQYAAIGGKSPIYEWTDLQGQEMAKKLDELSPQTAPHKHYVAFRYAPPLTTDAIDEMLADGVTRAVAFSQYPHYSCTTTGSSLNHLWREILKRGPAAEKQLKWSVIDRWPVHPTFARAVAERILIGLEKFPRENRSQVVILFTAHSLPMKVVNKGDPYPQEVAATVSAVMTSALPRLHQRNPYVLAWQSKVGFLPWLGPSTADVLQGLGRQGNQYVLAVPIAFTSDHIETLYEIDIEYAHVAKEAGIKMFHRAPALNDEPLLSTAMAEIVSEHLKSEEVSTSQYWFNCAACTNPECRTIVNPIQSYQKLRDTYDSPSSVPMWPGKPEKQ